jgi:hypothetical protein
MQFTRIKVDKGQGVPRETLLKMNKTMQEFAYWTAGYLGGSVGMWK